MSPDVPSLAQVSRQPAHRSLWYSGLIRRAHPAPVHDWLIEQANLRGFYGAYGPVSFTRVADPRLGHEELVVALIAPQAPADGRTLKLVVRMLQSGRTDADLLHLWARRERAEGVLRWLLALVPAEECTPPLAALQGRFKFAPRGDRGVQYAYDPQRLVRRPAGRVQVWRTK